jgi:hypothetical protein
MTSIESSTAQNKRGQVPEVCALDIVNMALNVVEDGVDHTSLLDWGLRFPDTVKTDELSLPPLDSVTVHSDDDSCASSISSFGEHTSSGSPESPRLIFTKYWEKEGRSSIRFERPLTFSPKKTLDSDDESSTDNAYERPNEGQEEATKSQSSNSKRRKIFNKTCWSESQTALSLSNPATRNLRKAQSSGALRPKQSCLRCNRYSRGQQMSDASEGSSKSSVRFSSNVDVKVFKPPTEIYATTGWSNWFA